MALSRLKNLLGGDRLNVSKRFELLDKGISGGTSTFYKAKEKGTGNIVGLKVLDAKKSAEIEARYKGLEKPTEGEVAVQIKHPNVAETYEHGMTTDGSPYLVMEYLEGANLDRLLNTHDKHLSGRRSIFLKQAAEGLAAVHDAGFIHRDVCPQNFVLTADGDHLKLIDFGSAVPAKRAFTQPGQRAGRRNYMAPELIARRQTDKRVDVFAFGVTAYRVCSLAYPWSEANVATMLLNNQAATPIREVCPNMNPKLADAIHACLEPGLDSRCETMEDFLEMLDKAVAKQSGKSARHRHQQSS